MALILARSPYLVSRGNLDNNAYLFLDIGYVDSSGGEVILKSFPLTFRFQNKIDISPFIRDYFNDYEILTVKTRLNGNVSGVPQSEVVTTFLATDGYTYYEEGFNYDLSTYLENNLFYAGSNDLIYRYDSEGLTLPFVHSKVTSPYDLAVSYLNGVDTFYETDLIFNNNNQTSIKVSYVTDYISEELTDGQGNIIEDGLGNALLAILEISEDNKANVTKIVISDGENTKELTVITISKCKYTPYKIIFKNRFGVEEDLWFFKKNTKSIAVEKETYRPNIAGSYANGVLSHQYQDYNVNGRESIVLNTGFVNESFSENIKQLMLSEKVWMYDNGIKRPMNVSTSEMELRTHVNDKLINYTMEFQFSNEIINNVS